MNMSWIAPHSHQRAAGFGDCDRQWPQRKWQLFNKCNWRGVKGRHVLEGRRRSRKMHALCLSTHSVWRDAVHLEAAGSEQAEPARGHLYTKQDMALRCRLSMILHVCRLERKCPTCATHQINSGVRMLPIEFANGPATPQGRIGAGRWASPSARLRSLCKMLGPWPGRLSSHGRCAP